MAGYGNCRAYINSIESLYVVPYVLTILYEAGWFLFSTLQIINLTLYSSVTLTLSLIRITRWRRRIPERMRAPLLDTLWRDGTAQSFSHQDHRLTTPYPRRLLLQLDSW